jgi:hypothetical protein
MVVEEKKYAAILLFYFCRSITAKTKNYDSLKRDTFNSKKNCKDVKSTINIFLKEANLIQILLHFEFLMNIKINRLAGLFHIVVFSKKEHKICS